MNSPLTGLTMLGLPLSWQPSSSGSVTPGWALAHFVCALRHVPRVNRDGGEVGEPLRLTDAPRRSGRCRRGLTGRWRADSRVCACHRGRRGRRGRRNRRWLPRRRRRHRTRRIGDDRRRRGADLHEIAVIVVSMTGHDRKSCRGEQGNCHGDDDETSTPVDDLAAELHQIVGIRSHAPCHTGSAAKVWSTRVEPVGTLLRSGRQTLRAPEW